MASHGFERQTEPLGDFGGTGTVDQQIQDLPLPPGQRTPRRAKARVRLGLAVQLVDQACAELARNRRLARQRAAQCAGERPVVEVLADVADSAGAQRAYGRVLVVGDRAEDHADGRQLAAQLLAHGDTFEARVADVDQHEIGARAAYRGDRVILAGGLGADHELAGGGDRFTHRATGQRVAVDQHEADDCLGPGVWGFDG